MKKTKGSDIAFRNNMTSHGTRALCHSPETLEEWKSEFTNQPSNQIDLGTTQWVGAADAYASKMTRKFMTLKFQL